MSTDFKYFVVDIQLFCGNITTKVIMKERDEMKLSSEKVKIARAAKQMSVAQLAKVYGVSRARMNVILNQREITVLCAGRLPQLWALT